MGSLTGSSNDNDSLTDIIKIVVGTANYENGQRHLEQSKPANSLLWLNVTSSHTDGANTAKVPEHDAELPCPSHNSRV